MWSLGIDIGGTHVNDLIATCQCMCPNHLNTNIFLDILGPDRWLMLRL